jgi:nicotinamidase-related amidase
MSFPFVPGPNVQVPEINYKDKVKLRADKTALIIIDMQNDFVHEGGSLVVDSAKETVPYIKSLVDKARKNKVIVCYTQDTQFENDKEWEIWPEHCRKGTRGWEIINELKPEENEMVFQKNRYDGFYGTGLEHYLSHVWHTENLIITGTVANICVAHTAASAGLRWYHIVVPANGISAMTEFDQALTLRQVSFLYTGTVVKSTEDIDFTR